MAKSVSHFLQRRRPSARPLNLIFRSPVPALWHRFSDLSRSARHHLSAQCSLTIRNSSTNVSYVGILIVCISLVIEVVATSYLIELTLCLQYLTCAVPPSPSADEHIGSQRAHLISSSAHQSPLSKPSGIDFKIYRIAHHSSHLPHCQLGRSRPPRPPSHPPMATSAPRSVMHQEHLAPGRITPQNLRIDRRLPAGRMRWSISQLLLRKHLISFVSVHLPMRQNRGCVDI